MGKMPLAGLMGACTIGMLLTGCNCCNKQNSRPSYMGGKADAPTDFTRSRPKSNSLGADLSAGSTPLDSTSSSGAGLTPPAQGMNGNGSGTVGGNVGRTMMPNNTGGAPMSGNYPALPSSNHSAGPLGANTTSRGGNAGLTDNGAGLAASGYGDNRAASAPIQPVGNRGDDSSTVKDAAYHGADSDTTSSMPSSGMGQMMVPPPPNVNPYPPPPPSSPMASSNSASPSMSSALPPPPPPSDNTNLLSAPPPSVNSGSPSSVSGMGTPTSASSGGPSSLPPYLK